MIVIPAIDIQNGKCVRLKQGRREDETVYADDPVRVAEKWAGEGAEWLHVVDLDGAFEKRTVNVETVRRIVKAVAIPVQVGGGIRELTDIERFLELGVRRVIIGTEAFANPERVQAAAERYPNRVSVGIDARDGWVSVEGWTRATSVRAVELARRFERWETGPLIFTDILKDGMQTGPNIEATRALASAVKTPVIASGGVASLQDIYNLLPLEASGVIGVITGKALYNNSLNLSEAIQAARKMPRKTELS